MSKLETKYLTDVDRQYDRPVAMSIITTAENELTRKYRRDKAYLAADLYAESAVLSAFSNNLTDAKNSAKDAVDAFTYDQEQEVKRFEYLYDYHSDFLDSLKAEDKAIIDEAKIAAQDAKDKMETDKTQIMEWKIKYPYSGIKLTDTIEEANQKIEDWSKEQPGEVDMLSVAEAKSLGVPYGTTRAQAMGMGITPTTGGGDAQELSSIENRLLASKRGVKINKETQQSVPFEEDFVDLDTYLRERTTADISPSEFDDRFGYMLSIDDRKNLEVPDELNKWESESTVWQWLATPEAVALSDGEKAQQIKSFGLNPESFGIYTYE